MIPSGPPTPIAGAQSVSSVHLRSNSAILGSRGGSVSQQATNSSLVSSPAQYNMNLLASSPNVSSLLNQNFGNGVSSSSLSGLGGFQRGSGDTMMERNPVSMNQNGIGFTSPYTQTNMMNSVSSGQVQSQKMSNHVGCSTFPHQQSQIQQFEQKAMQQFPVSCSQPQQQQPQVQSVHGGLRGAAAPVKLEPEVMNDPIGPQPKFQSLQSLNPVKLEPQQNHLLQQQRILQLQQQKQQQQLSRRLPQHLPQLNQQSQQQNVLVRSARPLYEPGTCARRLIQYLYQKQHRPADNNIDFWRKFVLEFFTRSARRRWCVSLYGNSRQTNGVFHQNLWHCGICNHKSGRGFEATFEVLPRLFKIKYDSGTLEELLYVDMPHEYQNSSGQIVLDYAKAIQESVFEHLRVVRDGQLRIVFSPDLKICSWEFCARHHEELIPRRLIIPQLSQLGAAAQKYQASAQNASSSSSRSELDRNCSMFLASARQLAKALEVPLVNDLGYTKRYVRCLQISEVVNSMKDLIDFSQKTGKGPMESLAQYPRMYGRSLGLHFSVQQPEEQQQIRGHTMNSDCHHGQTNAVHSSTSSGAASADNSYGMVSTTSVATLGLGHQENQMNNPGSPCTGTPLQIPSAGSSTTPQPAQPNPSSPFSSSTPSSSNNPPPTSHSMQTTSTTANNVGSESSPTQVMMQQTCQSNEVDPSDSLTSVEKIVQEIMISSQLSGEHSVVSADCEGKSMKKVNGIEFKKQKFLSGGNCPEGSAMVDSNSSTMGAGFCSSGCGNDLSSTTTEIKAAVRNNSGTLTGRVSMPFMHHDTHDQLEEFNNRLIDGLEATHGFLDNQFDWRSP